MSLLLRTAHKFDVLAARVEVAQCPGPGDVLALLQAADGLLRGADGLGDLLRGEPGLLAHGAQPWTEESGGDDAEPGHARERNSGEHLPQPARRGLGLVLRHLPGMVRLIVDAEFSDDLEEALKIAGYSPTEPGMLDLDAIEARAKAATQGRWALEREELNAEDFSDEEQDMAFIYRIGPWEVEGHTALWDTATDEDHDRIEADAAFMEQAVPDTLALVAEVRRAREEAQLWKALARILNGDCACGGLSRGLVCARCKRADEAVAALRALGIDPEAS